MLTHSILHSMHVNHKSELMTKIMYLNRNLLALSSETHKFCNYKRNVLFNFNSENLQLHIKRHRDFHNNDTLLLYILSKA